MASGGIRQSIITPRYGVHVLLAVAWAAGITSASGQVTAGNGGEKGTVTGRVIWSDTKTPARVAQVMLVKLTSGPAVTEKDNPRGRAGAALNSFAQTALDGQFEMTDVPAGKYIVLAQQNGAINPLSHLDLETLNSLKVGHVSEEQIRDALPFLTVVTVSGGKTVDAAVSLSHGASVSGVVKYDDESPAVGVQIHLMSKTKSGGYDEPSLTTLGMASSNATATGYSTDDAGRFHIAGLLPGTYAVRATLPLNLLKNLVDKLRSVMAMGASSPDSLASAMKYDDGLSVYSGNVFSPGELKPIELSKDEAYTSANITVPLAGMHSLEVHVDDSATGTAVTVAQVMLMDANGVETLRGCFVDDHGDCRFDYVPDGTYLVKVSDALDTSAVGNLGSRAYDPKKAIPYDSARAKAQVSDKPAKVILQLSKAPIREITVPGAGQ